MSTQKIDTESIALEVKKLITQEVNKRQQESKDFKEKYIDLIERIESSFVQSYLTYMDYNKAELNFSSIEAEGAYRGILTLCNEIGIQTEKLKR